MSVATEISRIQGLRNDLRTKLVSLGLVQSSAVLEDCVDAVEGVSNNGAVAGTIASKDVDYTVPAGYHSGAGKVSLTGDIEEALAAI